MEQTSCLLPTVHNDYCAPRLIKNGSFQMSYWLALAEDSRAKVTVPIDEEGNFSVSCENFPEGNDKEICKNATWFTAHTPDGTGWAGIWGMAQWNGLVVKELIFRQCSIDQNTPCKATY